MARLTVLVLLLAASSARAQDRCPAPPEASEALAERTPEERMAFILERARGVERSARTWSVTFALAYLGVAATQLAVLVASSDPGGRADAGVGAVSSMIGVASVVFMPIPVLRDREELERIAPRAMDGDCDALARAEAILAHDAAGEDFGSSWLMHVGSALFNLGIGAFQGLVYGRWESGAISAAVGIVVGELSILTKPRGLVGALASYREGDFETPRVVLQPQLGASFAGLALSGSFR